MCGSLQTVGTQDVGEEVKFNKCTSTWSPHSPLWAFQTIQKAYLYNILVLNYQRAGRYVLLVSSTLYKKGVGGISLNMKQVVVVVQKPNSYTHHF